MIESLRGELIRRSPGHIVVECHGVGYLVQVSEHTAEALPPKGPCLVQVHYTVSVDVRSGQSEHRLYGFATEAERHLFRQLIDVQGVSSTLGLAILSARKPDEVRSAILAGDVALLKGIKGIGPKLAQRIVQELGGRLGEEPLDASAGGSATGGNTLKSEALSALISLGLDRVKAERALQAILNERKAEPPGLEELIRLTLKNL
ncbi:MAG: Holliday junction branch migration protein RuvA [Flavobacteriales bacterium]|nr:Holliday junction branch migration protein RuvA [Flavobacteriales bacterium]MCB0782678.1 Holliday junction branch migration protein RuvA [Flavobacteriales bacterium]MCB0809535.1 Holliday junction branch migration protein RuvA [Flavobacteriales bacterium]MCB0816861.1 Holliday junction branch migration protein RuvA [Flavobacteriales bacterium]HOP42351.1 Holliday junction branch migration protein RuvA [Flavobacteriales bacterium]